METNEAMDDEVDASVPLSSLSYEFRTLVSNLLNPKRVLTTDGPNKLPRDWRGLAFLLQISTELAGSISESQDKTGRLLDLWMQRGDGTATLQNLMEYLTQLDRYDIYDDIIELGRLGRLIAPPMQNGNELARVNGSRNDNMIITFDDRRDGFPHYYHAYVLFAQEDWMFVRELLARMKAAGYKLCTEYDIDVGYGTQYAPVAQLISERCYRIILVYSPNFIDSPANSFYSDYAQAVGIESNKRNIIPIIYRQCQLPHHLMYYHRLVYKPGEWAPYDFWEKLAQTLGKIKLPGPNGITSAHSTLTISELPANGDSNFLNTKALTSSYSVSDINTLQVDISQLNNSGSLSSDSQASSQIPVKKKREKTVTKVFRFFSGKKKVYDQC
ncbi:hypothetical protein ABMA28_013971 [Loxostege sticticalis]|uniref:Myeloid differentiation primary response protein MyD88 n=1 Tax=Loxostege sticticalis TaxID=481309 RepID=A0ABD0TF34_LOXSC